LTQHRIASLGVTLGLFGDRASDKETSIDSFISQKILLPQVFLKPAPDEEHFRIYGHAKFEFNRLALLNRSVAEGAPFWQGKVFLICREAVDDKALTSRMFDVIFEDKIIGEISEYDTKAKQLFEFELGNKYVGRAVIRADLIGNLVHLFVNPENRIA
jgi:hypothetical protein